MASVHQKQPLPKVAVSRSPPGSFGTGAGKVLDTFTAPGGDWLQATPSPIRASTTAPADNFVSMISLKTIETQIPLILADKTRCIGHTRIAVDSCCHFLPRKIQDSRRDRDAEIGKTFQFADDLA